MARYGNDLNTPRTWETRHIGNGWGHWPANRPGYNTPRGYDAGVRGRPSPGGPQTYDTGWRAGPQRRQARRGHSSYYGASLPGPGSRAERYDHGYGYYGVSR